MNVPIRPLVRFTQGCAVALAFTLASIPSGGAVARAEPAAETAPSGLALPGAHPARPTTAADIASYQGREKKASAELAKFAGGDVVVITASTIAIVVLVVLLILLIR